MNDVEEELAEFVREAFVDEEIDMDYEFDAARFFDFCRAETDSEAEEAERWFESAGYHPPSPFIIKLNWRQGIPIVVANTFAKSTDVNANNNRGLHNRVTEDLSRAKANCQVKSTVSRNSTLMKPTASHLAKQNHVSIRLRKKLGNIDGKSSQNSSVTDDLATKRQKLEAGYLSKGTQLKHQALLLRKVPKKVWLDGVTASAKLKATIPREPDLETAHRAQTRRYKVNAELGKQAKSIASTFKARGTNRKDRDMADCSSHGKTTDGKRSNSFNGLMLARSNSVNGLMQEKCNTVNNFEACCPNKKKLSVTGKFCISPHIKQATNEVPRGLNCSTDKRFQDEPLVYLFSKLCLESEAQENTKPPLSSEGTRGKNLGSFVQEHKIINVVKERSERLGGKDYGSCGLGWSIPELQLYVKRSVDIH